MIGTNLSDKDKVILVKHYIRIYKQAIAKRQIKILNNVFDESQEYDNDKTIIFLVENALRNMTSKLRLIIKNDFIEIQEDKWYLVYFSKSAYYRHRKNAINEFINLLNI